MKNDIPLPIRYGLVIVLGGLLLSGQQAFAQEMSQEKKLIEAYSRFYENALVAKKSQALEDQKAFLSSVIDVLQLRYDQLNRTIQKHPTLSDAEKKELGDSIEVYVREFKNIKKDVAKAYSSYEINQAGKKLSDLRAAYKQTTQRHILKTYLSSFEETVLSLLRKELSKVHVSAAEKIEKDIEGIEKTLESIYFILDSGEVNIKEVSTGINTIDATLKNIYSLFRELSVTIQEESIGIGSLLE